MSPFKHLRSAPNKNKVKGREILEKRIPSQYEVDIQQGMLVSMEDTQNVVNDGDGSTMLIDAREARPL